MYEKFTDRSRKVMQFANTEASRLNHSQVGVEHIILGLVKEGSGAAVFILRGFSINLVDIRLAIEAAFVEGPEAVAQVKLPLDSDAKQILENACAEALRLVHDGVGTEHLLIALMNLSENAASDLFVEFLKQRDVDVDSVRAAVLKRLQPTDTALTRVNFNIPASEFCRFFLFFNALHIELEHLSILSQYHCEAIIPIEYEEMVWLFVALFKGEKTPDEPTAEA